MLDKKLFKLLNVASYVTWYEGGLDLPVVL